MPALKSAIQKFNSYCDTLATLAEAESNSTVPLPHHLSRKLLALQSDPYLMEDVWVNSTIGPGPEWLTDGDVRKGICAMLKSDHCLEERWRLTTSVNGLDINLQP